MGEFYINSISIKLSLFKSLVSWGKTVIPFASPGATSIQETINCPELLLAS